VVIVVPIGVIICVDGITIVGMGLVQTMGCWYWVRWTLFRGTDGSSVGGSGIVVNEGACGVSSIDSGFGGVVIVGIVDIDRIIVVIVAAKWLVQAGSCCCCCRLLGWTGG